MSERITIDRLWPSPHADLGDDMLLEAYAFPEADSWLRMNFISSADGAATREGLSGGLGDEADRRVFSLLRRLADVVLVAAGTAREEGYEAMRLSDADAAWREVCGLPAHPAFALVTRSADLDPRSLIFTNAPVRPIVYTVAGADAERRAALERVAEVVLVGEDDTDLTAIRADLVTRGLTRMHSEGGPSFFGAALAAGIVDELCLTVAPTLEGGTARRIAASAEAAPTPLHLVGVMRAGDELLLRYATRRM